MDLKQEIINAVIAQLFAGGSASCMTATNPLIGKFCIVRTIGAGVHAGIVSSIDGESVTLAVGSLRLYYWKANADKGALHSVAKFGLNAEKSKTERAAGIVTLINAVELIEVAPDAVSKIVEEWK